MLRTAHRTTHRHCESASLDWASRLRSLVSISLMRERAGTGPPRSQLGRDTGSLPVRPPDPIQDVG
jgi:hypothetical protein